MNTRPISIAFFGSSLLSAYWNGAATYYRGIIAALHRRGHRVTFYEPDAFDRQSHRDLEPPPWAEVVVYRPEPNELVRCLGRAAHADVIVKASGVGVLDAELEVGVLAAALPRSVVVFWDVDAPATLDRLRADPYDPLLPLVGRYDAVLTYGGGAPVVDAYRSMGARECVPIYNALDPSTHHPVEPDPAFAVDLAFLGNRLPDREARVHELFLRPAQALPERRFLLGGSGWADVARSPNVELLGHVYTEQHNVFNCSPRAVLNVSRESMARYGHSPATRVFEAAGAGACLVTDAWEGLSRFLEPGREVLVAEDGDDVVRHVEALSPERARSIGQAARRRVLAEHTYDRRAAEVETVLEELITAKRQPLPSPRRIVAPGPSTPAPPPAAARLEIVVLGLSITSSWGNGHAVTYRGLVRELSARGHRVTFLERDVPWYAEHRDLPQPPWGTLRLYRDVDELRRRWRAAIAAADVVIVGSYVPDGIEVLDLVLEEAQGVRAFYDIDTPVTLAALERGECAYLDARVIPRLDLYLSFTGGPTLARIEQEFGARRARALYCSIDPETYRPLQRGKQWDIGYLGTYSADRQPRVDALLDRVAWARPDARFVVAGPQYPAELAWAPNVDRLEHVPPHEHADFYARQRLTLNVTRADMVRAGWSPSIRLFEAAACGTAIVSDCWEGLETLLVPGEEILVADTTEDVLRILDTTDDAELAALGMAARRKVLAAHTAAQRVLELEHHLAEVRSGTKSSTSRSATGLHARGLP